MGGWLLKPVFKKIKKRIDYEEYGGAPLLGINGISLVAHGKSKEKAIVSAIRTAVECVETKMIQKISRLSSKTNHVTNNSVGLSGIGHYLPDHIMSNQAFVDRGMDTSPGWIETRTGIQTRHIASKDERTSDMATAAAKHLISV